MVPGLQQSWLGTATQPGLRQPVHLRRHLLVVLHTGPDLAGGLRAGSDARLCQLLLHYQGDGPAGARPRHAQEAT